MPVTKLVGLNLGSRNRSIPDFLNMDIDQHEGVDIVGDVSDLSRFDDASIENIYASHILEHFPHPRTLSVLKEWHRVLVPGGKLYVGVPDFERTVEIYHAWGSVGDWIVNYLCGDQLYPTAYHYNLFDETRLTQYLKDAGFSEAFRVEQFPIGEETDCSNNRSSIDGQFVSLNMVAIR